MAHNKLYRNFIILQEDERGYSHSNDKALSGYAKVEAKGDKCKVSFYAQNLRQEDNYSMVLICCKRDLKQLIDLGPLVINGVGKGDTSKEYYVNNIAGLGISYEKISGAAICKVKGNEAEFIMHGFMNGEESTDNWRKFKIVKVDSKKYINKLDADIKKKDDISLEVVDKAIIPPSKTVETTFAKAIKTENGLGDHKKDEDNLKSKVNIEVKSLNKDNSKSDIISPIKSVETTSIKAFKTENGLGERKKDENKLQSNSNIQFGILDENNSKLGDKQQKIDENINTFDGDRSKCKEEKKYEKCEKSENIEECINKLAKHLDTYDGVIDLRINNLHEDIIVYGFIRNKKNDNCKWKKFKLEDKCRSDNQNSNYKQSNFKRIEENFRLDKLDEIDQLYKANRLDISDFEQYENNIQQVGASNNIQQATSNQGFKMNGEVSQYFEKLAEDFEPYNGSLVDINYCKLYQINVNNIQDLCDESNYNKYTLAYYPMLNYYPYISKTGYFLLGYKCNKNGEMQYIVYGIPGEKEKNEQPYGGKTGFVTWTKNNENNKGYWLMFYDFKNSKIVIPTI